MRSARTQRGIGMIETLVVLVIFTSLATMVGTMTIRLKDDAQAELDRVQALLLAEEGIVALSTLRDIDINFLTVGIHGLHFENGTWSLTDTPDVSGRFTRTLTLVENENDSFDATCAVAWDGLRSGSIELETTLTDMYEMFGASKFVTLDTALAQWSSSSTELSGIYLINTDTQPHTITTIMSSWSGDALLYNVAFDTVNVFSVATSSAKGTNTSIDIDDYEVAAGGSVAVSLLFTELGNGTQNALQVQLEDGTIRNSFFNVE